MKKMNKFFALAALAAAAMTLSSCGTEWLAAVGQGMVGASQAILGAGGATATAGGGSASTFLSGNAGTMSVDGGVPYGNVT